ncbi:MAG TPA: amino acid adenylation domain-containing protein, partial [Thermoanaerobaculia bacterium]|nr:amino acid adenylation domain-containing protein [Thermoanaerobaculia bacterium]
PSPLPELPVQYPDYAEWQRERLSDPAVTDGLVAWWKERLADAPELLPLPTDRPRPAEQTPWGRRSPLTLSAAHSAGLRELSQREGTTLFVTLLAVFKALLSRLAGEEKLIVGTPSGHRALPELQEVLGFFLNQLVFYTDLSGDPPLREVLARVKETALSAYAHEELPFPRLVEALRPGRDLSRIPFTQVVLLLLNPQQMAEQFAGDDPSAGLGVDNYWVDSHRTQFDMTLSMWESRTSPVLAGWWEYNTDLFDATTIDRMKEQLRMMVAAFVAEPGRPLWEVPLLTESERHQMTEWNDTVVPGLPPLVTRLFADRVAATPGAPAVVFAGETLTFGELDLRAGRLAQRLAALGVGPGSRVGLFLERSADLAVAVLGVWKAGGAWVPLDPAQPETRLAWMVEDSFRGLDRPVLVTQERLRERLAALPLADAAVVWIDAAEPEVGRLPAVDPRPGDLAYLIYTSGTTGRPKASLVEHGNLAHFLRSQSVSDFREGDRLPSLSPFSFDVFLSELLLPVLAGGTCVIVDTRQGIDLERLLDEIERATCVDLVPAVMRQVIQGLRGRAGGSLPQIRRVFTGSEAVPPDVVDGMREVFPAARITILYGPTEGTVQCSFYDLGSSLYEGGEAGRAMLGRPLPDAVLEVRDRAGRLAPIGVRGELWLGGPAVCRGYLHQPELTAEKFPVLDGRRFYRTGDLVRRLPDGHLEFLGRIDQQVKIRGIRVEPGEIEAALALLPEVREAAVVPRAAPAGKGLRLVAYVVPEEVGGEVSPLVATALRDHLRERMPEYMVPAAWVVLPALPRTTSGKVDRNALPEPPDPAAEEAVAPRTLVEERLVAIWREVLGVPRVGVHDNFFTLGGDSILSIQVIARARRAGIALVPRMLFQHQTVAELAAVAGAVAGIQAEQGPVAGPVPLTPIQRWFFDQEPPEPWHDNQALLLESRRQLAPPRLAAALARTAFHHDALRLRFRRGEEGWEQWGAVPEPVSPLLAVDLSALPEPAQPGEVEAVAAAAQRSLDLAQGPLHRPVLFDLGADRPGRFLWVIHHLAVDGVSWRLLLEDLAAVYDGLQLPAKTTSYKAWSERLAGFSESEVLRREAGWWLEQPWGEVAPLPSGAAAGTAERSVSLWLDPEATRALLQEVPRAYNSQVNDALLSALARAFQSWTGSPVLLLDLEGHGREEIFPDVDLSRTVGWFTSVFPVLLDLRDAAGPGEALKAVKEHLRRIPNGGLGWGVLQASPEANRLAALPRPEVGFNYLGQVDQGLPAGLPFGVAAESAGPNRSPRAQRPHRLEWNGSVSGGRLHLTCAYGEGDFHPAAVERLLVELERALRELIDHCREPETGGYTPSDFPLAGLSQGQLDEILAQRRKSQ